MVPLPRIKRLHRKPCQKNLPRDQIDNIRREKFELIRYSIQKPTKEPEAKLNKIL